MTALNEDRAVPVVELCGVAKRYPRLADGGDEAGTAVLEGVDLAVGAGESVAIVGPSGSGKSTLLNILGALHEPSSGSVRFEGEDLGTCSADELAVIRNRKIGFVFQSHHLLPQCSALENVLVPTLVHPDATLRREAPDRAIALLTRVGLGERRDHRPAQLSGGECQRVAVVRALINRPRLLLADEPTGSLDAASTDALAGLLAGLVEDEDVALVTVTHSAAVAARMQRVLELRDGRLTPAPAAAGSS